MIQMNSTASAIQGVFDNLRIQLQMLDSEIKADEKSKAEFERHLQILSQKKADIEVRMKANEEWSKSYDTDIGPFAQKSLSPLLLPSPLLFLWLTHLAGRYKQMTNEIASIYDNAKQGHVRGIKLLVGAIFSLPM